jgi:predicted Zn-ribbon and HTH transcriptional regulator
MSQTQIDIACNVPTRSGTPCRLVGRWRCDRCGLVSCGVHVMRERRTTRCPACKSEPVEIRSGGNAFARAYGSFAGVENG